MPIDLLATIQTGPYVNPYKVAIPVVVLLIWVRLLAWVDKDAPEVHLPREIVNCSLFVVFIVGYLLYFLMPGFGPAIGALMGAFFLDIAGYLGVRAKVAGLDDLKEEFVDWLKGIFKSKKARDVKAAKGQVVFINKAGTPQEVPEEEAAEFAQFQAAQSFIVKPLKRGAERMDLLASDAPKVSHTVDGIAYDGDVMDRNAAAGAVQYFKTLGGLDLNEHRKPQTGNFKVKADAAKPLPMHLTSQGNNTGEAIKILVDPKNRHNHKLEEIGLMEDQLATFKKSREEGGGLILLATPKGQGLTSLAYAVIRSHDAFMYHILTVERSPEVDLEGVTQNALPTNATGAEESKQVNWVVSQEPDVLMVTSIEDRNSAADLAKFATDTKRVYVCIRAGSTFEALAQWRRLVGDDALAMKNLRLVIAGRLVRKLCDACKVAYTPDPNQLRKMNMSQDTAAKFYSGRKEPMRDAKGNIVPCNFCQDLGFKGRFGVFEIFQIDDDTRKVVMAGGSEAQLKQIFRKQRGRLLQEIALDQVKAGETSVEEVLRVLKADPPGGSAAAQGGGGGAAPAAAPRAGAPRGAPTARAPQPKPTPKT